MSFNFGVILFFQITALLQMKQEIKRRLPKEWQSIIMKIKSDKKKSFIYFIFVAYNRKR